MKIIKFGRRIQNKNITSLDVIPSEFRYQINNEMIHFISVGAYGEHEVTDGEFIGCDLVISSVFSNDVTSTCIQKVAGIRIINIDRFNKSTYNAIFNANARELRLNKYQPVIVNSAANSFVPEPTKQYILRYKLGARGIGMILLDPNGASIEKINGILCSTASGRATVNALNENGVQISTEGAWTDECLVTCIPQSTSQMDVVEFIPNVQNEWRVMTDYRGRPSLVVERKFHMSEAGFKQARGNGLDKVKALTLTRSTIPKEIQKELTKLIIQCKLPLHSLDVFMTKEGNWGLFEGCPEFGHTSLPDGWVCDQGKKFIAYSAFNL